jgi:hypothetical protein
VKFCRTPRGLFAVALDEDDFFEPFPLAEDDVKVYEVTVPRLIQRIRQDNDIVGSHNSTETGLIPIGQKQVAGYGAVEVFLSLPNADPGAFTVRCLALRKPAGVRCLAILLPIPVTLPAADREQLDSRNITLIPLLPSTDQGHFRIDWNLIISSASGHRPDGMYPPRTIVFRGLEYSCELTKAEMTFIDIALRNEEIDIGTLHNRKGMIWKGTFINDQAHRNKITKFLSRLNDKLSRATPPFPLVFSLPRNRQTITRSHDGIPPNDTLSH